MSLLIFILCFSSKCFSIQNPLVFHYYVVHVFDSFVLSATNRLPKHTLSPQGTYANIFIHTEKEDSAIRGQMSVMKMAFRIHDFITGCEIYV